MAIKAQSSNQVTKITVKQSRQNLPIELGQSAQHFNNLSELWATSPNIVENKDYSSKYYAEISKQKAQEATEQTEAGEAILNELNANKETLLEEINTTAETCINSLQEEKNNCTIQIINTAQETTNEINNIKNNAVTQLSKEAQEQLKNIESTGFYMRDDKLYFINSEGEEEEFKSGGAGAVMFDTKIADHVLQGEEALGWALQGTYVYKEAIAGSRLGYPDFYAKCLGEHNEATNTETINGVTVKVHSNGHKFYNIEDKTSIDEFFNAIGSAWFYGVDTENERVFLPRDKYFAVKGIAPVVGNGLALGLDQGDGYRFLSRANPQYQQSLGVSNTVNGTAKTLGKLDSGDYAKSSGNWAVGVTTNATKSGIEAHIEANEDKYLYICVGNTISNTSWVDVVTQVEGGVKDLEDKTLEGIERLKASSTALTQTQITNCLLEVPQNIKLELNDGTLTLKAGSKVIVPNGFEEDGTTPKFDEVVIENDIAVICGNAGTRVCFVSRDVQCRDSDIRFLYSGATPPDTPSTSARWYDTSSNLLKEYIDGVWVTSDNYYSLPFAVCTANTDKIFTSIDQTFNGLGYIGSTIWVDKGVKGLIPDGRNEDGSLKNIEFTTSKLLMTTNPANAKVNLGIYITDNNIGRIDLKTYKYDEEKNLNYDGENKSYTYGAIVARFDRDTTGTVTNFKPKLPFRAIDYSDKSEIISWGLPDYSAGVSITFPYTATKDGILFIKTDAKGSNVLNINDAQICQCFIASAYGHTFSRIVPISRNDTAEIRTGSYNATFFPYKGVN